MLFNLLLNFGCTSGPGDCSYTAELAEANGLSQANLLALHARVAAMSPGKHRNVAITTTLKAKYVRRKEKDAVAMLGGCFDDKLLMYFDHIPTVGQPKAAPVVRLVWGDWGSQPQPTTTLYP